MKRFVLRFLLFFACVVVMDLLFGWVFKAMRTHAKGGSTANCEYIANLATDDIIILGSSRATHHYIPQMISDSLGVSCYNCGEEGNGVVLAYGRLRMLTDRYNPKLVLYDITPNYDYGNQESNIKYLGYLRAYYDQNGIREIFDDFDDDLSQIKMLSKMYQNTSRLLPDLADNIIVRDNHYGYEPLYGTMDPSDVEFTNTGGSLITIDSLKLSYVEKLILLCQNKGIPLVFMISPQFGDSSSIDYLPAIELCERYSIRVYNNLANPNIIQSAMYFHDKGHLNNIGAIEYTNSIIPIIRVLINNR